ncbi:MAG TPA: lipase family protein [Acidimicrobiales bacterium]|nr:lipase family protein [Acidimicrobiales bacterium]
MHVLRSRRRIAVALLLAGAVSTFGPIRPASATPVRPDVPDQLDALAAPRALGLPAPDDDPFYVPAAGFEAQAPGTILRTRAVTVTGLGIPLPVRSTQMLVRSTDAKGRPTAVVSTLMLPPTLYFGKRPLLSYQPATDSLGDECNPSYLMRLGIEKELPLMALGLLKGWAVVVTDYQGPDDAYGSGLMSGRAVLDGIRAAERLGSTGLAGSSTPVGMWGYSGGGLATSWATQLQPSYASELNVRGVASGGTPADLRAAATQIDGGPFSGLFLAAAVGLSRQYPEMLAVMDDQGRAMIDQIGDMCYAEEAIAFPFRHLNEFTTSSDPLNDPVVAAVLAENTLGGARPSAPVYLYHSVFDELIPYDSAQALRTAWCSRGARVQFSTDVASEHIVLAVTGAPGALAYLNARFLGLPAPSNC